MPYKNLLKKREAAKRWYYKNKDKIHKYKAKVRLAQRLYIKRLKEVPCKDCGVEYPYYVMDFDHRDGNTKLRNVGANASYGWKMLKEEVAKCDVVCVNCHRIRTSQRRLLNLSLNRLGGHKK